MPVVSKGFQQSLDDRGLSRQTERLQVKTQGLVDPQALEAESAETTLVKSARLKAA